MRADRTGIDVMDLGQELGHKRDVRDVAAGRLAQVQLDPVAGAQNDRLAPITGGQVGGGRVPLRIGERKPLAQGHIGRSKADADGEEVHRAPSIAANGCATTSVISTIANAATVR